MLDFNSEKIQEILCVKLSKSTTVLDYIRMLECNNKNIIADFLIERFTERYISPLRGDTDQKHGFCTMAISCLMIEALESFAQGLPDSKSKSKKVFSSFFRRCYDWGLELGIFCYIADDFYTGIRCGILHQAETTNGWLIHRKGELFNSEEKSINATKFHDELEKYL